MGKVRDSGIPPPYLPARTSRPSPEDQVRFIANIERILSEGSFVATYKYALLVALVELYWRQAAPYEADGVSGVGLVLHQNKGKQAGAITRLARLRDELKGNRSTLAEARRTAEWKRLVGQMQSLLKTMPLWRLQRVGHEDIRFLYEPGPGAGFAGCSRTRPRTGTRTDGGQRQGLWDTTAVPAGPHLAPVTRGPGPVHRQHRAHPF